jgi:preprotein translocase subunit SecG
MNIFFIISQIVLSILVVLLILIQNKGTGFGRAWGGGGSSFTRRGLEKVVFRATFVISALFIIVSLLQLA